MGSVEITDQPMPKVAMEFVQRGEKKKLRNYGFYFLCLYYNASKNVKKFCYIHQRYCNNVTEKLTLQTP